MEDLEEHEATLDPISSDLVDDILDTMHTYQGERLMRSMNIPDVYCEIAGMHHDPEVEAENRILNVVRLGNLACRKVGVGLKHDHELHLETTSEVINLDSTDQLLDGLLVRLEEYHEWLESFLP